MTYDYPADRQTNGRISEMMGMPLSDRDVRNHLGNYSTDVAEAWRVIEHISRHWVFSKRQRFYYHLANQLRTTDGSPIAWPDALGVLAVRKEFPIVVCRAALAAHEEKPTHE